MQTDVTGPSTQVRDLLLSVLADARKLVEFSATELDLTLRVARRVKLLGRIACQVDRAGIRERVPQAARDQLVSARVIAQARERTARWELDRLAWALSGTSYEPLVVLKGGAYLLLGLPNAAGRLLTDVDLLVPEALLEHVEEHLIRMGWRSLGFTPYDQHYYRVWTHELPPMRHVEREFEVDLHHNILPRTSRLRPSPERLLEGLRPAITDPYHCFSSETLVLHCMTHLMFDSDLSDTLRDLVDTDDLIRWYSEREPNFWEHLLERAVVLDLRRPVFYALRYAQMYLKCPVPDAASGAVAGWGPPRIVLYLMDALVPRAMFPPHPEHVDGLMKVARFLLYLRSHWIRMPPWLLARHLAYKFYVTQIRRVPKQDAEDSAPR